MHIGRLSKAISFPVLLCTLALGLCSFLRGVANSVPPPHQLDFTQFYVMAHMLRTDRDSSVYDPTVAQEHCTSLGIEPCMLTNYPPFVAMLFYPLSFLPFRQAEVVHFYTNLLLTVGVTVWAWRKVPPDRTWVRWIAVLFIVLLPATTKSLLLGQINALLGSLLCLAIGNVGNRRRDWLVIGSLSLASAIKLWPIGLSVVLLIRKQYRLAIGSVLGFLLLTSLGFLVAGPRIVWHGYLTSRLPETSIAMAQSGEVVNQSVWGVATRLFSGETTHQARLTVDDNTELRVTPLTRSRVLYWLTIAVYVAALAAVLLWVTVRRPHKTSYPGPRGYWVVFVGLLTVLPFSWDHYAFYLIYPLVHLLSEAGSQRTQVAILGMLCLLLLLIQRFSAYLPQHGLLLGFGFVAEVVMVGYLAATLSVQQNENPNRHPVHAWPKGRFRPISN